VEKEARDFGSRLMDGILGFVLGAFVGFFAAYWVPGGVTIILISALAGFGLGFRFGLTALWVMWFLIPW
jgi:hypothetical protein